MECLKHLFFLFFSTTSIGKGVGRIFNFTKLLIIFPLTDDMFSILNFSKNARQLNSLLFIRQIYLQVCVTSQREDGNYLA